MERAHGQREKDRKRCRAATSSIPTGQVLSRAPAAGPALFRSRTNGCRFTEGVHAGALRARERGDHRSSLIVSRRDTVIAAH